MPPDAPTSTTSTTSTTSSPSPITLSTGTAALTPALAAERLLDWLYAQPPHDVVTSDAIPLDALVARLDLDAEPFSPALHPNTLGYLEPGENLIFLRSDLPEPLRRFTLAHEMGHAALHRGTGLAALVARGLISATGEANAAVVLAPDATSPDGCADTDLDAPLDGFGAEDEILRPGQAYSARARRENEANAFAAALLLPANALLTRYLGDPAPTARELAQRFGVSEDVVLRRLTALLTPKQPDEAMAPPDGLASARPTPTLDPDQQAAARVGTTPALIIAGPGAGKTSALLGRIGHLVVDRNADPTAILALTFSNKAAREMRERLALMGLAGDGLASGHDSAPTVSTIHAFCGELLRRYAPLVGLRADFRLVNEVEAYLLL
ncbi:MAG: UvrD-helicase domain-containing protein, partial [Ktedonobacterales bacterium]